MLMNDERNYGSASRFIHWLMVAIVMLQYVYGVSIAIFGFTKFHQAIDGTVETLGILLMPLLFIRIALLLVSQKPKLPEHIANWQVLLSHMIQGLIYLFIFLSVLTGFLIRNENHISDQLIFHNHYNFASIGIVHQLHFWSITALGVLIIFHIAAALKHRFLDKDEVLDMMLPGKKRVSS
ncbi:cytochrome b/b6 domain-containing protein [Thiotrichales bacterium 19S9-12]|nr:cytochrome b/b6 domain-containing protein [Thiotrichales bacterium 19S9-11]MCF6811789.1 cytochrome b/b6 domain-containing protein [Thiotrichales bacterium 19S9-12]